MKPSKQVKRAFRKFKKKSSATNLSMKQWAKNVGEDNLKPVVAAWFANKK